MHLEWIVSSSFLFAKRFVYSMHASLSISQMENLIVSQIVPGNVKEKRLQLEKDLLHPF